MPTLSPAQAVSRGIALMELLIVLAILALLAGASVPSWTSMMDAQRLKGTAAELMASLQLARAEAVRSGLTVVLAPREQGWASGWAVAQDRNGNRLIDPGERIVHARGTLPSRLEVQVRFPGSQIAFGPGGRPAGAGAVLLEINGVRRKLIVNTIGRTRMCDPDRNDVPC